MFETINIFCALLKYCTKVIRNNKIKKCMCKVGYMLSVRESIRNGNASC